MWGGRFFDRQSVDVDTNAHDRPRPARLQLGHATRAGCSGALVPAEQPSPLQKRVARGNRITELREPAHDRLAGPLLLPAKLSEFVEGAAVFRKLPNANPGRQLRHKLRTGYAQRSTSETKDRARLLSH